jgi:hypothetical protein
MATIQRVILMKPEKPGIIDILFLLFLVLAVFAAARTLYFSGGLFVFFAAALSAVYVFFLPKTRRFSRKHKIASTFIILAAAVAPRIIFLYFITAKPAGDFETYNLLANGIAKGTLLTNPDMPVRYASIFPHTVSYPVFLSGFIRVYDNAVFWARVLSVICSGASAVISGVIAAKIQKENYLSGGLLYALFPSAIYYCALMATESLFIVLELSAILMFICFIRESGNHGAIPKKLFFIISFCVTLALANSVRPLGYVILIASAVTLILKGFAGMPYRIPKALAAIILIILFYTLSSAVLMQGTARLLGREIAASPAGFNIYVGMNTESRGKWNQSDSELFSEYARNNDLSPQRIHDRFLGMGVSRAVIAGFSLFKLAVSKFDVMWGGDHESVDYIKHAADARRTKVSFNKYEPCLKTAANIYYLAVLLAALYFTAAELISKSADPLKLYPALIILGIFGLHIIVEAASRYHAPALPLLCVFAVGSKGE